MTTLYAVILAGGVGSGLWPVSREMFPKQLFKLNDDMSLFQRTFLNLAELIDDKNIITVTNVKYASSIKEQLKTLQIKFGRKTEYKTLVEPESKNTAAATALAVKYIQNIKNFSVEDSAILVVPSDRIIFDRKEFALYTEKGTELAKEGYIVSFSTETKEINPNFGYMKAMKNKKVAEIEPCALKVNKFIEKPDTKEKKEKLKGKIFVNTGMYMFTGKVFASELKRYEPKIYKEFASASISDEIPSVKQALYDKIPFISLDYAIAETSKKLVTIPVPELSKDIGSWNAIYEISEKDKNGNCFKGKIINIDSKDSFVYSPNKLTAVIGLKDKNVVVTEDAILVSDINDLTATKNIYKKINGENKKTKEIHETVYRPWGNYSVLETGEGFLTKCITVNPDSKLSLQIHHHRSEHWVVLEGCATVIKGKETLTLNPGESVDINVEEVHSLQNLTEKTLKVLEIQQGDILDENDIVRLKDIYGRV